MKLTLFSDRHFGEICKHTFENFQLYIFQYMITIFNFNFTRNVNYNFTLVNSKHFNVTITFDFMSTKHRLSFSKISLQIITLTFNFINTTNTLTRKISSYIQKKSRLIFCLLHLCTEEQRTLTVQPS